MRILQIIVFFLIAFPLSAGDADEAKKNILGRFTDGVSSAFGGLTSFDGIKRADLEIDSKNQDFESDVRASIITSLSEDEANKSFWLNQTNFSTQDDRETFNTGFIFRRLSEDNKWLSGFNLFYDHELDYDHQRASFGIEIKSTPIEFNANNYARISSDKTIGSSTERAMDGFDIEVGLQVPYMPTSKLFVSGYEWSGSDYDIKFGNKIGLRLRPSSSLEIELGAEDNNQWRDYKATAKIQFIKRIGERIPDSGLYFSDKAFEFKDMSGEIYEKVRRQNRIVRTVAGTVTIARGT
tara:strand:+ start:1887 stop:2771 length:885 start_codon:yes stop_codon:yes gene_type:complete